MQDIVEHANATLEIVELEKLWGEELKCASNTPHNCTEKALYSVTTDCWAPDTFWCQGRFQMYLEDAAMETECAACFRSVTHWNIRAL